MMDWNRCGCLSLLDREQKPTADYECREARRSGRCTLIISVPPFPAEPGCSPRELESNRAFMTFYSFSAFNTSSTLPCTCSGFKRKSATLDRTFAAAVESESSATHGATQVEVPGGTACPADLAVHFLASDKHGHACEIAIPKRGVGHARCIYTLRT